MDHSRVLFYNNPRNVVVVTCCTFSFLLVLRLSTAFYLVYPHLQGNKNDKCHVILVCLSHVA